MLEDPRVIRVLAYQRSSLLAAGGTFGSSLQAFRGGDLRGQRVLSSATPAVLGDFTHHYSIRQETAVAKFSSGRLGARPPPPVGRSPIVRRPADSTFLANSSLPWLLAERHVAAPSDIAER